MASFSATRAAFTPSTSNDNWTLEADTAGDVGRVTSIWWGGRGTTSTGYRTRWTRPTSAPSGSATTLTLGENNPNTAATCIVASTYATTQPTLGTDPAGNLFDQDWNVAGGGGAIILPYGGQWFVIGNAAAAYSYISCRNVAGTDANISNYGLSWEE